MKMTRIFFRFALVAILIAAFSSCSFADDTEFRTRYMGTSIFSAPTGFVRSAACYINDNGHSAMLISQAFMNNFLEVSMLRHFSGYAKGKNPLSLKVRLLEEGAVIPSVVWGASDLNKQLGSKIFYFAASKNIEVFGVQLHAGFYKHPVSTDKKTFFGIEKMVFPLVTISAERSDGTDTYGLKLSPYPGVSLEFAQRDRKEELYNINYIRSF